MPEYDEHDDATVDTTSISNVAESGPDDEIVEHVADTHTITSDLHESVSPLCGQGAAQASNAQAMSSNVGVTAYRDALDAQATDARIVVRRARAEPMIVTGANLRDSYTEEVQAEVAAHRQEHPDGLYVAFHVVGSRWQPGDDLLCADLLPQDIERIAGTAEIPHDSDVISLCETLEEARKWRDQRRPGGRILRVQLPPYVEVISNNERNPSVLRVISAGHLELVE